jgi:putative FmdB family regulatory protein
MPTYDYRCRSCKHSFEFFQSMKEEPLKICPNCSGELQRLIGTGAGPIFKGSGFYQTDYKNVSSKKDSAKSSSDSKSAEKKPAADASPAKKD